MLGHVSGIPGCLESVKASSFAAWENDWNFKASYESGACGHWSKNLCAVSEFPHSD